MTMIRDSISPEHLNKYLGITKEALEKLRIAVPERSFGYTIAADFLKMAASYYSDALHFRDAGDAVNSFAAVNYAHGWIDCGVRLGLFDGGGDDGLFTLYE